MASRVIDRERVINIANSLISWKLITEKQRCKIIEKYDKLYEVKPNFSPK